VNTIKSLITGLALAAVAGAGAVAADAEIRPLAGGVTFRTDDNGTNPEYFRRRAAVFDKHGLKFGAAVNLLAAESQPGMIEALREIQKNGHDLMDHTPCHNNLAMGFARDEDIAWIQGRPGVDHIEKKAVYLKYVLTVPPADRESRRVNVAGNRLTPVETEGAERWFKDQEFLYFPEPKVLCRVNHREAVNGVYPLKSAWGEDNIDLKTLAGVPVQRVPTHEIQPTPEALALLAQTIHRVCDRNGLIYPVTYAAPGNSPHLTRATVKSSYGDKFGYRSAGVYPEAVARVFNEPDPKGDAPFAMQWGDVNDETPGSDLPAVKKRIAGLLAVNKVVIIGSHVVQSPAAWPAYYEKMDALLAWLKAKNIPVKSHADWADILYRSGKRLTGNIFPSLDRDLDEDGNPDGYELVNAKPGDAPAGAALPEKHTLTADKPGTLFRVQALGGLPHGDAELACWLNGPAGTSVNVMVHGVGKASFVLKEGWNRYTAPLTVPANAATARVDFDWQSKQGGTVSVCGIAYSERTASEK
jgi:hypothetical protein